MSTFGEHGVFVVIEGRGVFIRGRAGIGKSSLALELLDRGHRLLSDDIVDFYPDPQHGLMARCPNMLTGLLAVRDLGILDIRRLFTVNHLQLTSRVDYIIELCDELPPQNPACDIRAELNLHSYRFPGQAIHAHPKRNLALIIETLIKNYILYESGEDSGKLLAERQQQYL